MRPAPHRAGTRRLRARARQPPHVSLHRGYERRAVAGLGDDLHEAAAHDRRVGDAADFLHVLRTRDTKPQRERQRGLAADAGRQVGGSRSHLGAGARHAEAADPIEEAASQLARPPDPLVRRCGAQKENCIKPLISEHFAELSGLFQRQVQRQDPVHSRGGGAAGKGLEPHPGHRVGVGEEDQGHLQPWPHVGDQRQDLVERRASSQGPLRRTLNHRAVGQRVRKRDAHFNHVGARSRECQQDIARPLQRRVTRRDVGHEPRSALGFQPLECRRNT